MSSKTPKVELTEYQKHLLEKYPFISYIGYGGNEYIGIVQNVDDYLTSVYDFGSLRTEDEKSLFLALGDTWWWKVIV